MSVGSEDRRVGEGGGALFIGACIVAIPLLLPILNGGAFWDGLIYEVLSSGGTLEMFADSGLPLYAAIPILASRVDQYVLAIRIVWAVAGMVTLLAIMSIVRHLDPGSNGKRQSAIAVLALLYPANLVGFETVNVPYQVFFTAFLCSLVLSLKSLEAKRPAARIILLVGAVALGCVSTNLNSVVAWLPLSGYVVHQAALGRGVQRAERLRLAALPSLVPLAYFLIHRRVFRPIGLYEGYNEPGFGLGRIATHAGNFFAYGIWKPINDALLIYVENPLLLLVVATLLLAAPPPRDRGAAEENTSATRAHGNSWSLFGFGVVSAILGAGPYIVAGKSPEPGDAWSGRHAILLGLPMAFVLVGGLRLLAAARPPLSRIQAPVIIVLGFSFWISQCENALEWIARWNKDEGIIVTLSPMKSCAEGTVYWIQDDAPTTDAAYRFYEWAALFRKSWGGERRIGFSSGACDLDCAQGILSRLGKNNRARFRGLSEFREDGRELEVRVVPGPEFLDGKWRLGLRALAYQLLGPARWRAFQTRIVSVECRAVVPRLSVEGRVESGRPRVSSNEGIETRGGDPDVSPGLASAAIRRSREQ